MHRYVPNPVIVRGVFPRGTPHDYMLHATLFEEKGFWARRPFLKIERHLTFCFVRNDGFMAEGTSSYGLERTERREESTGTSRRFSDCQS